MIKKCIFYLRNAGITNSIFAIRLSFSAGKVFVNISLANRRIFTVFLYGRISNYKNSFYLIEESTYGTH